MTQARPVAVAVLAPAPIVCPPDLPARLGIPGGQVSLVRSPARGGRPAWHVLRVSGTAGSTFDAARAREVLRPLGTDVVVVPGPLVAAAPGLVVTDVDSTLITQEVIEELAGHAGTREQVAEVTARAMDGELDFAESLRLRVATLAGVPATVFGEVLAAIVPTPGAGDLVETVHASGGAFGVVSGGFEEVVAPLCRGMGIDHWVANHLEVRDGYLTGRVSGEIVTSATKVWKLREWAAEHDVPLELTVAMGDGANDVPMMHTAGLGVAFCAKPTVRAAVPDTISVQRLDALAGILALPGTPGRSAH